MLKKRAKHAKVDSLSLTHFFLFSIPIVMGYCVLHTTVGKSLTLSAKPSLLQSHLF